MSKTYGSFTISDISDGVGIAKSIPYYLASNKSTGVTVNDPGWSRTVPELTPENKYLWIYYANVKGVGDSEPVLYQQSGEMVTFDNNGGEAPLDDIKVNIEPVQSGSGDPSPTNVRPITGFTEANVARRGKNLLPPKTAFEPITTNGLTFTCLDNGNGVNINGTATGSTSTNFNVVTLTLPVGTYKFIGVPSSYGSDVWLRIGKNTIAGELIKTIYYNDNTLTLTEETKIGIRMYIKNGTAINNEDVYLMIVREEETDYTFEAYQSDTYEITFPSEAGTVYGGTLDVSTGELTVTMAEVDLGTLNWAYTSNTNRMYTTGLANVIKIPATASSHANIICDRYAEDTSTNTANHVMDKTIYVPTNGYLGVYDTDYTVSATFKAAMSGAQLVYELAEPITYHITPQQITALTGENHIWSDSNSIDVSRYANVSMGDPYVIGVYGDSSTAYRLIISDSVVTKDTVGNYSPSTITVSAKAQTGVDAVGDYAGRFKIQTTTDNSTWTDRYTSSSAETSKTYTVPANIAAIRCILYDSSGANLLDQQTVPIIADAKGVSSIKEQYYLSTNDTTQTGDSWQDTPQTYISGRYYWTRSEITWDDNTVTHTTPVLANDINSVMDANADANNKIAQMSEIIYGTQTEKTRFWTGTSSTLTELTDGTQISYWLPYNYLEETATSKGITASELTPAETITSKYSNDWLKLTLADGTTTAWVPCYYGGTSRLTSHYGANNLIKLTYRTNVGSIAYGWWADANYNANTNYFDRRQHSGAVKAATAITAKTLIGGTIAGYKTLGANVEFDLGYPILYASAAIAANATRADTYEALNGVDFSITGAIQSDGTSNVAKMLYLKGSVTGNVFKCAATNWLTTVVPASADNMYYIPLGIMTSEIAGYFATSNRLYGYYNGAFQALDTAGIGLAVTAQNTIDNLQIGGRNLYIVNDQVDGFLSANASSITSQSASKEVTSDFIAVTAGESYSIQAWTPNNANSNLQPWIGYAFYTSASMSDKVDNRVAKYGNAGDTYLYYKDIVAPNTAKFLRVSYRTLGDVDAHIKVEHSNRLSDWTPAPEDVSAKIDTALSSIEDLTTQLDGKVETWICNVNPATNWNASEYESHDGDLWFYTGLTNSTVGSITIEPAKTYQFNGDGTWSSYNNPTESLFDRIDGKTSIYYGTTATIVKPTYPLEDGDYLVDSSSKKTYRWNDTTSKWDELSDYVKAISDAVDNIEVGGRNYCLNSKGVLASGLGSEAGSKKEYQKIDLGRELPLEAGETITISFDLYMTINTANPSLTVYNTNVKGPHNPVSEYKGVLALTGGPFNVGDIIDKRVSYTTTLGAGPASGGQTHDWLEFYSNYGSSNWFSISNLKIEKGNKATDWTPAPEDAIESLDVEYYLSDSSSALSGGSWSTTAPAWVNNKYMWSRQKVTYGNGVVEYKNQTCIAGAKGSTGTAGLNQATLYLYKRSITAPTTKPTGMTYTFASKALSGTFNDWSQSIPNNSTDPIWITMATASSNTASDTIDNSEWTAPVMIAQNGQDGGTGASGYNQATIYLYQRAVSAPNKPGTLTYTFANGAITENITPWERTIPSSNGNPCWVTSAAAIDTNPSTSVSGWSDVSKLAEDGYTITLSNENHSFAAGTSAAVAGSTTCDVEAYKGGTKKTCYVGSSASVKTLSTGVNGLTCSITNNNSQKVTLTFSATTDLTTQNGSVTIPVHVDGYTFNKTFSFSLSLTGPSGVSATGLAAIVNASTYNATDPDNGEVYYHGFDDNNKAADVNGWVNWNGRQVTIPKGYGINPNKTMPYNTVLYSVYRLTSATADTGQFHDVCWIESSKGWFANTYSAVSTAPSARAAWTWNEATDIILAMYVEPSSDGAITNFQLFTPPKKYSELTEQIGAIASQAQNDIENLSIGGRNLIRGTGDVSQYDKWVFLRAAVWDKGIIRLTSNTSGAYARGIADYLRYGDYKDQAYVFSFDAKIVDPEYYDTVEPNLITGTTSTNGKYAELNGSEYHILSSFYYFTEEGQALLAGNTDDYITVSFDYQLVGAVSAEGNKAGMYAQINYNQGNAKLHSVEPNESGHFSETFKLVSDQANYVAQFRFRVRLRYTVEGAYMRITHPKITIGTEDTPWVPSPGEPSYDSVVMPDKMTAYIGVITPSRNATATNFGNEYERYINRTFPLVQNFKWNRYSLNFVVPDDFTLGPEEVLVDDNYLQIQVGLSANKYAVDIRNVKLEKGNRASDWTPAPEDADSQISTALSSIEELTTQLDGKVETWCRNTNPDGDAWNTADRDKHNGDLWYYTGTTEITDIVQSPSITIKPSCTYKFIANGAKWERYDNQSESLFDHADGKSTIYYGDKESYTVNGKEEDRDYLIDSVSGKTYVWDANASGANKWALLTDYVSDIADAVDALEIGGSNLLRGTDAPVKDENVKLTRASVEENLLVLKPTTSPSYVKWIVDYLDYEEYGSGVYTLSCEAKGVEPDGESTYTSSNLALYIGIVPVDRISSAVNFNKMFERCTSFTFNDINRESWTRYSHTFCVPDDLKIGNAAALVNGSMLAVQFVESAERLPIAIRNVKLERGSKATGWQPTHEDIQKEIDDKVEVLDTSLDYREVFARLTKNATENGLYMDDSGNLYLNGTYLQANTVGVDTLTGTISNAAGWSINFRTGTITIGSISASKISGDTLNLGGNQTNPGLLVVKDSSNTEIGRWGTGGITIKKGTIRGSQIYLGGADNGIGAIFVYGENADPATSGQSTCWGLSVGKDGLAFQVVGKNSNNVLTAMTAGQIYGHHSESDPTATNNWTKKGIRLNGSQYIGLSITGNTNYYYDLTATGHSFYGPTTFSGVTYFGSGAYINSSGVLVTNGKLTDWQTALGIPIKTAYFDLYTYSSLSSGQISEVTYTPSDDSGKKALTNFMGITFFCSHNGVIAQAKTISMTSSPTLKYVVINASPNTLSNVVIRAIITYKST